MTNWIEISQSNEFEDLNLPKPDEPNGEYTYFSSSMEVLFTDGKNIYIGTMTVDKDEDWYDNGFELSWRTGRSGWEIDGVTHWSYLPDLPK